MSHRRQATIRRVGGRRRSLIPSNCCAAWAINGKSLEIALTIPEFASISGQTKLRTPIMPSTARKRQAIYTRRRCVRVRPYLGRGAGARSFGRVKGAPLPSSFIANDRKHLPPH
jgi:hypothetical protein